MKPYFYETKAEFFSLLRMPRYAIGAIAFPVMFYIFFGLLMRQGQAGGISAAAYMLSTFGTIGIMTAALWALGAGVAMERGLGWLQLKRASPMPPLAYYAAKIASTAMFAVIIVALLYSLAAAFGGVRMAPQHWGLLALTLVAGIIPFCALGLILGYLAGPNSSPAVVNIVSLPMAFCSGLWVPIDYMPQAVQKIAPILPAYHLAQLGLGAIGGPMRGSFTGHLQALTAMTLIFAGCAWIAWRRDEGKNYG